MQILVSDLVLLPALRLILMIDLIRQIKVINSRVDLSEFFSLRNHLPVVDVRSEGEYNIGHIPGAINIPILNNDERKSVGTDYKQKGQKEAIMTGFRLIGPRLPDILEDAE